MGNGICRLIVAMMKKMTKNSLYMVIKMKKERVSVTLLNREIQLYNKQHEVIYTTFFPYMYYAEKIDVLGKNIIFRENIDGATIYYIFDKDNNRIIILRDDEKDFENVLKKVRGAIVKEITEKFKIQKFGVQELESGFHIIINNSPVTDKYRSDVIKPELLPPMPVFYTREKDDDGNINEDYMINWKDYLNAIYFAVRINYTNDVTEKVRMLYEEADKSIDDIAKDLNMSYSNVRYMLIKNKVKLRRKRVPDEVRKKIIELAKQGMSARKISEELNLNSGTVLRILRKENLVNRKKKVSEEEINAIIQLYKEGKSIYEIAKRLKRSTSLIFKYLKDNGLI